MTYILIALICTISWMDVSALSANASCDAEAAGWTQAYEALARGIESCRYLKQESITVRVEQELEKTALRRSMAQCVQEVLKERTRSLGESKTICLELAERERSAYAEWRRCAGAGGRRGRPDLQGPDSVARQRNELLVLLQDVLLDEAYVQYKNYRDPSRGAQTPSDQNPYLSGQTFWPR